MSWMRISVKVSIRRRGFKKKNYIDLSALGEKKNPQQGLGEAVSPLWVQGVRGQIFRKILTCSAPYFSPFKPIQVKFRLEISRAINNSVNPQFIPIDRRRKTLFWKKVNLWWEKVSGWQKRNIQFSKILMFSANFPRELCVW